MANFLGGAMRALSRSPKTAKFVDTLNHADLPRGWSDDPEIQRMAFEAWRNMRFESPFFRAFYKNSKLVDEAGRPIVFYHGSRSPELDAIDPDMSRLMRQQGSGSSFAARNPVTALAYVARPGAKLDDPLYQNFRRTVEDALLAGQDFTVPDRHGLGMKTIGMGPVALRSPKDSPDFYLHELEKSIADDEWKRGAARLSAAYEAGPRRPAGHPRRRRLGAPRVRALPRGQLGRAGLRRAGRHILPPRAGKDLSRLHKR